jgi:hypothetical protein
MEGNEMKKGATVGLMSVFAGVLLATLTSVYACHTFHGGGRYSIDSIDDLAQFQLNPNSVQVNIAHNDDSTSFQMQAHSTTFDFAIPCDPDLPRTVIITGEMESTVMLGTGSERQTFTETVPFTVFGEDKAPPPPPEVDGDSLSLKLCYSADGGQGPPFAALFGGCALKPEACDQTTCEITFAGDVVDGDLSIHTAGGGQ